jgi:hypothetical protein
MGDWFGQHWFVLLQSVGIIGSLLFTAVTLREDTKTRQVANLITITGHHREIWTQLYRRPELARVLDPHVDLQREPVRVEEALFINLLILHLRSVFHAVKQGLYLKPEGLGKDIAWFFSLPIPKLIWERNKAVQDEAFACFVDAARSKSERSCAG